MNTSHHLFNPFRAIPVVFALILNVVMGPLGPVVQSQLLGNQTVMAYVGSTAFELDGNIDTTTAGHDWNQVHTDFLNGNTALSGADNVAFITDKVDTTADDIFTGGGSKDQQKIQTGPWLWTTSKPQPKDDITHAFAAAYTIGGHTIAYFGLDKYEVDGDNQVGFWFFKNPVAKTNTSSQGGFTFSGEHAVGDILVLSDYTNGGAVPNFTVYKWVGSGGSDGSLDKVADTGACTNASQFACGITNGQQFTSSAWPYQNRDVAANTWPAGGLFEGGLDLTHFNLDTGCFSSFLAETRSSQSVTATLSDFALGQFSFCEPPEMTTQVSQATASVGDSFTDSATLSGNKGDIGGKVDFYVCGPTQSAQDCASTANKVSTETIANPDNPVTVTSDPVTATAAGWYCFLAKYTPPADSKYEPTEHTNNTTECVHVLPAVIHVTKTADAASVSAGQPIGFTVTVSNTGTGQAKGVTLSDALPGGNVGHPVTWVKDALYDAASFTLAGAAGSQTLALAGQPITLDPGASLKVHISAATTKDNCATYNNQADVAATNDGSDSATASTQVLCPNLQVTKTADADSVSAGSPIGFTVEIKNIGAGNATGVTLNDALPAGNAPHPVHWAIDTSKFDFGSFAIGGADGSQALTLAGQPVGLAAGASLKVHITAATTKDNCAVYDNTANVASTNDGSPSASDSETVLCPDLYVTKTHDAASVSAGSPIGFTVVIGNNGPGAAAGVTLSDSLPGGNGAHPVHWVIDGSTGNPASFAISGADGSQVLSLAGQPIGLAASASLTVHVIAQTNEQNCAVYDNTANVASTNDGSPSASASETVLCPALSIVKTSDATPVDAGDAIGFAITVSNSSAQGTGTATAVTLSDPLPAGVTWSISPAYAGPGTCAVTGAVNSQILSCSFGDMAPGASASVHLSATTSFVACATYPNTATADATNHAPFTASATIDCLKPDLAITKTAEPAGPVNAGEQIGFAITVSNSDAEGTGTAKSVTLSDPLPAGGDVDWSISPAYSGPGSCSISGSVGDQKLNCSFGDMAPDASATVHLVSDTSNSEGDCTTFPNVASVSASNHPTLTAQASVTVQCPGLNVEKTTDTPSINGGDQAHFTIKVWNVGTGTALDATLTDKLPAGDSGALDWSISPAYSGPGSCSISGAAGSQTLSCSFGDLAGGTSKDDPSATISLVATTSRADCGPLVNTATVDASNNDPRSSSASIEVTCPVIQIVKANNQPDPVLPGTDVTYTLTVTVSDGPANEVTVVDTLPAGLDAPTAISDSGAWDSGARTITWTFASLADGAKLLSYHAKVSAGDTHGQTLTNNVYVTSTNTQCPDTETLAEECQSSSTVTVRVPGLVIDKAASVDEVHFVFNANGSLKSVTPANATVTWTLTYTLANGPVTNAVISDPLPDFLTFVSADNGGTYDSTTRTITWQFATLSASGKVSFVTTVDQDAPETGPIVNVASIVSDQTPKDEGRDSVRVTSEQVEAATPSVPNTATVAGPNGQPIQIPIELLVLFFLGSLGTLTFANVRAVRRRR